MDKLICVALGLALIVAALGERTMTAPDDGQPTGGAMMSAGQRPASTFTQGDGEPGRYAALAPAAADAGIPLVNPIPAASMLSGRVITDRFQPDPASGTQP
ncbi:hypothetical protein WG907_07025 [Sphingobium sp. AN558]|uniref:hypothetical protein n=1 Tax=Sphingobium sp. AN558 TaxID=3133442 RepID=UPI0030BB90EF